jgi:hypothetical protein
LIPRPRDIPPLAQRKAASRIREDEFTYKEKFTNQSKTPRVGGPPVPLAGEEMLRLPTLMPPEKPKKAVFAQLREQFQLDNERFKE